MRSGRKNGKRSNSSRTSSPAKDRSPLSSSSHFETRPNRSNPRATTVLDRELVTATGEDIAAFQDLQTSPDYNNPRSFPYSIKQKCWEKAEKIKGRDPDRWRRDPLGNTIFRKLVGCPGCLCHDYDHILPYSKGGKSTLENCQVLQATVNRSKGNRTDISRADLMQKSSYCRVSGSDMDLLELSAYGNVRRGKDSGGCNIQ